MTINIPVSLGELIDKIAILEIKYLFTNNEHVKNELDDLQKIKESLTQFTLIHEVELKKVNEKLWVVENRIRQKEKLKQFDEEFIELARSVYILNDKRSSIKKNINEENNSNYTEIKYYN